MTTLLDAWREPDADVCLIVEGWLATRPLSGVYVTRSVDLRMIWNYLQHVGPAVVARKVRSRFWERIRNRKWAGIGVGTIIECPARNGLRVGTQVVFFAPNHSIVWPRLCLNQALVCDHATRSRTSTVDAETALAELEHLAGWSPFSGIPVDGGAVRSILSALTERPVAARHGRSRGGREVVRERRECGAAPSGRPTAVLFGLGNYAKTQIIPSLRRHLTLAAIHEIDPDQISTAARMGASLDTSPHPRRGERYDAWFIAGFHHTHADLAAHALRNAAYAIVEKPLATTPAQLALLTAAARAASGRRLFACFQRRYAEFNSWARQDLGVAAGDPVDMHCLVYEIPLPPLHWYNWPNSGSRLVSNGCHWLDYFMYMNDYSPVIDRFARAMRGDDVLVHVRLENGAQLSLSITDTGSDRLGVRDLIDLRAGRKTVRVIDSSHYEAESHSRFVRRAHVNPIGVYRCMYDAICRAIVANESGDRLETLRSTELMLDLDEELKGHQGSVVSASKSRERLADLRER